MGAFDEIANRRIRAGQDAGAFDGLDGAGRPIRDIDKVRPPGWWAARLAAKERHKLAAEELTREIADTMPTLWREATEAAVRERVDRLNTEIERYNTATTWERIEPLDLDAVVERWRGLAHYRVRRSDRTD